LGRKDIEVLMAGPLFPTSQLVHTLTNLEITEEVFDRLYGLLSTRSPMQKSPHRSLRRRPMDGSVNN